jgi:RNA polymerase sigma-70 factor (ECF subfamily)
MDSETLARHFERARPHLTSVAFRIVGSLQDAEDVVQSAWLKADQSGARDVANLPGWFTTITARAALDANKARLRRRETAWDSVSGREPPVESAEERALLADSVDRALLVVLDRLSPAERAAFVLHDVFALPFDEIGAVLDRSPGTAKKLASRARAKIHLAPGDPGPERASHSRIVTAFLTASQGGDIEALLRLLVPDVVRTVDPTFAPPGTATTLQGAREVAEETRQFAARARAATVLLVDGRPGIAIAPGGRLAAIIEVTIGDDHLVHHLRIVADRHRLAEVRLSLAGPRPL